MTVKDMKNSSTPEVSMIICGANMKAATSLINGNAFPDDIEKEIRAAVVKLSLFLTAKTELLTSLDLARDDLFEHLKRNWIPYKKACGTRQDIDMVAYSDGLAYMSHFNMFLYEAKSFLDIFTRIVCHLVDKNSSPVHGFNKGKVDGQKISGGKLINWVRNQADGNFERKDELLALLTKNCIGWINEAVKYRDDLAHYKGIDDFQHMKMPVSNGPTEFTKDLILYPAMPDGTSIVDYSNYICENLCKFIENLLLLFTEVKKELNTTWEQAKAEMKS